MSDDPTPIDFAQVRRQVTMAQVLVHLGYWTRLRGTGPQRRGPCPVHQRGDEPDLCFSVNLHRNIFQCFDAGCRAQGNVLDLWTAVHGLPLREAAKDIAVTFGVVLACATTSGGTRYQRAKHAGLPANRDDLRPRASKSTR